METPLQPLFQAIVQTQDKAELRGAMMAKLAAIEKWLSAGEAVLFL